MSPRCEGGVGDQILGGGVEVAVAASTYCAVALRRAASHGPGVQVCWARTAPDSRILLDFHTEAAASRARRSASSLPGSLSWPRTHSRANSAGGWKQAVFSRYQCLTRK